MDFEDILNKWQGFRDGHVATEQDVAELLEAARSSEQAPGYLWAMMEEELLDHGGFGSGKADNKKIVAREVKKCRITADLGVMPGTVGEFITAFLASRGYVMNYLGQFTDGVSGEESDVNYITNKLRLWNEEFRQWSQQGIDAALAVWMEDEKQRIRRAAVADLRFDAAVDPNRDELKKLIGLVLAVTDAPLEDDRNRRACEIALANFIHRVKNHMKKRWTTSTHLMPIFCGRQGDGKSTVVQQLLSAIDGLWIETGFEMFEDRSSMNQLGHIPVMFFEELAGVGKADVERLKGVMMAKNRQMRENFEKATAKTPMSTFIGCTNRDISGLIKDETGNRRFIQFMTRPVDRLAVFGIDAVKIWQSVDENAEAPLYATPEDHAVIQGIQAEQRSVGLVERWIYDDVNIAWDAFLKASEHFRERFRPWLEDVSPGDVKFYNEQRLGRELTALVRDQGVDIKTKVVHKQSRYAIAKPECIAADGPITRADNVVAMTTRLRQASERSQASGQG